MVNVYLLRHGQTDYNAQGNKYCGRTDISMNEKGLRQANELREQMQGMVFDGVFSSPLNRAKETARIVTGQEPQTDERLIEIDFGLWEGKTRGDFVAEDPETWEQWERDPMLHRAGRTGESGAEVLERVTSFFNDLAPGNYLVVAHNGVNRLFLAHQLGMPLRNYRKLVQENSRITRLRISEEEGFVLEMLNAKL
jgi:broad specificity phosphatase PhoE